MLIFDHPVVSVLLSLVINYLTVSASTPLTLRVVTWNVGDNKKMGNGFTDAAIDKVLGLTTAGAPQTPAIYAIGLQENCWMCNQKNLGKLADRFLKRIQRVGKSFNFQYVNVGVIGTRMSATCQIGCKLPGGLSSHGTTALVVIAQKSLAATHFPFKHNAGCHSKMIQNVEKGIAAMKVTIKGGKTICFGTAHLDSAYTGYRRQCLKNFFESSNANRAISWSESCDAQFMFGDFNTRTGDKQKEEKGAEYLSVSTNVDPLKKMDEFTGRKPYTTDGETGNMLQFINAIQPKTFNESDVTFMPTYSIKPPADCNNQFPCYRKARPKSWTDRIIYTVPKGVELEVSYDAIVEYYSDHLPVFADFSVNL